MRWKGNDKCIVMFTLWVKQDDVNLWGIRVLPKGSKVTGEEGGTKKVWRKVVKIGVLFVKVDSELEGNWFNMIGSGSSRGMEET